jgi:hypothetical protein
MACTNWIAISERAHAIDPNITTHNVPKFCKKGYLFAVCDGDPKRSPDRVSMQYRRTITGERMRILQNFGDTTKHRQYGARGDGWRVNDAVRAHRESVTLDILIEQTIKNQYTLRYLHKL